MLNFVRIVVHIINKGKINMNKKKIPAGKKGKGLRKLKAKAPHIAKKMGYKKGGRTHG